MPAGVTGYAAINARVRVMYSTLLSPQVFDELCEAADWDSLVSLLKATDYGPYLERVKDRSLTPRRVVFQLKTRLSEAYGSVTRAAPDHARPILSTLFDHFEVENLKAVLRGIVGGSDWDRIRFVLFPMGTSSVLPFQEMVESGSVNGAVEMLRGSQYYETLSFAMKRYSLEQSLFPLEVALDLSHWRKLWAAVNRLTGDDRTFAIRIIGSMVDMNNMMWAVRYRTFHHLSEEELINYTLPFGHHVRDEDIRLIAAGADISQVVSRIWPRMNDVAEILRDPRQGLSKLELELQRHLANECRAAFVGNPFQIGIPLGFLILSELEIQDLTVLVEAKANHTPLAEFKPYLVLSGEPV